MAIEDYNLISLIRKHINYIKRSWLRGQMILRSHFINLKFIFSFVSLIYCWFIQFLLNNILQYDSIMMRLECPIILLNWSIDFILCAKPKFLPDNSCSTTCMCKDYIEFHCAAIWILANLQSRKIPCSNVK